MIATIYYTRSRLQRAPLPPTLVYNAQFFFLSKIFLIDINDKKVRLQRVPFKTSRFFMNEVLIRYELKSVWWLISTNGFGLGFQTLSLHCIMHNFFTGSDSDSDPCTDSFLNGYCTHFRDGSLSQEQISIPIPYIWIRGSESKSEPVEKPA